MCGFVNFAVKVVCLMLGSMVLGRGSVATASSQLMFAVNSLRAGQLPHHLVLPDGKMLDVEAVKQSARNIGGRPSDVLVFDVSSGTSRNLSDMVAPERSKWLCGNPEFAAYDPAIGFGFRTISSQTNLPAWLQLPGRVTWLPRMPAGGSCGYRFASLQATPPHIDFDQVAAGMPQVQAVTLRNLGGTNVALGALQTPRPPFALGADTCSGTTLTFGATCSFEVSFSSTGGGRVLDLAGIPSDDAAELQGYLLIVAGKQQSIFKNGFD